MPREFRIHESETSLPSQDVDLDSKFLPEAAMNLEDIQLSQKTVRQLERVAEKFSDGQVLTLPSESGETQEQWKIVSREGDEIIIRPLGPDTSSKDVIAIDSGELARERSLLGIIYN